MRIAFIGASRFGLRCLQLISRLDCCMLVGVVTAPETFSISYRPQGVTNVLFADVRDYCIKQGIPCSVIEKGMKDTLLLDKVKAWNPDAFIVVGWYHMIPKAWRELAPAYGFHASLLPDYSGGAPLVWAMINGEKETGISFFELGDGVDDGPIIAQARTDILPDDTIGTLYGRIEEFGLQLLFDYLPLLVKGTAVLKPQDERGRRVFPQRGPEDGRIDWTMSAQRIHDFIRAQTRPYPGAFAFFRGRKITIWQSAWLPDSLSSLGTGEARIESDRVVVGCGGGGLLEIILVGDSGQNIDAISWARENSIQPSEGLERWPFR